MRLPLKLQKTMHPDEKLHPLQIERFREMTFQEKLRISNAMFRFARDTRLRVYRRENPDWTEEQCRSAVANEFAHTRS